MSLKQHVLEVLEPIHERLTAIEDDTAESAARLQRIETKLDQVLAVFVGLHGDLSTLRSRVVEQANRDDVKFRRQEAKLVEHENRVHRLESLRNGTS